MRWLKHLNRQLIYGLISMSSILISLVFLYFQQPAAAVLTPLLGLLMAAILWRDTHARAITTLVSAGETLEKLEVPSGEWGDLTRAINGLLQERRRQQRLAQAMPLAIPDTALRSLLEDRSKPETDARLVVILLASTNELPFRDKPDVDSFEAWRACVEIARDQAQQHGALVQPSGNALLLVFGAFGDAPREAVITAALNTAEAISQSWQPRSERSHLRLGLVAGSALIAPLPGLGFCAMGTVIEQADQLERLAGNLPHFRLIADETAYYTLRLLGGPTWQVTGQHLAGPDGRQRPVFGLQQA